MDVFERLLRHVFCGPQSATTKPRRDPDDEVHYHHCSCGRVWCHTYNEAASGGDEGYAAAHRCPDCGSQQRTRCAPNISQARMARHERRQRKQQHNL